MAVRFGGLGLAAVLSALLAGGCARRESAVARGDRDQVLLIGNGVEPPDLDPELCTDTQTSNIMLALFEGLTQYDPRTCEPRPGVATSWEVSADQLTWTFHLRSDARWSNGDPVTAGDFVFAYRRMLSPAFAAPYSYFLYALKNGEEYFNGRISDPVQIGARAADDRTLVLTLAHPVPYLAAQVSHASWYPVNPRTILRFGKMDQRGTAWTRPGNLVGDGPFLLTEWHPREVVRVQPNPYYWNRSQIRLHEVDFYPIDSLDSEERAFRAGQLHLTSSIPLDRIAVYERDAPQLLRQTPYFGTYFYRFNVTQPPLNDVRIRRALSLAVDRERLVRDVLRSHQQPSGHLTAPGIPGFDFPPSNPFNVAEARRLLAEAGFPDGRAFPHVDVLINTNEAHRQIAEAIQRMWHDNLGIDSVGLYNQEATVYIDTMQHLHYQIARYGWIGDYLDPSSFLDIMRSDSGNNCTGWKNPEYDRLIEEANRTADQGRRFAYYRRCEQLLEDQCPILPLYTYVRIVLARPEVKGWYPNILDFHPFDGVYLQN